MRRYLVTLEHAAASDAIEVGVTVDGTTIPFDSGRPRRICTTVLKAVDDAIDLIVAWEHYRHGEFEAPFRRAGHVLAVAGEPRLRRLAIVHVEALHRVPVDRSGDGPPSNDDDGDAGADLTRVLAEWETLVRDDPSELEVARLHGTEAARRSSPDEIARIALLPRKRAAEVLGHLLEVIAGRSLVEHWASDVNCIVRVFPETAGEDGVEFLDPPTRKSFLAALAEGDAACLTQEADRTRRATMDALKDPPTTLGPRELLASSAHTATAWEVRLAEPRAWFNGVELLALFPAESCHADRRHRCTELAAKPARTIGVELDEDGTLVKLVSDGQDIASIPASSITAIAFAYAMADGRAARGRLPVAEIVTGIGKLTGDPERYASRKHDVVAMLDNARRGAIRRDEVRAFLDHVLGKDPLERAFEGFLAKHTSMPGAESRVLAKALRKAARRYESRVKMCVADTKHSQLEAATLQLKDAIRVRIDDAASQFAATIESLSARTFSSAKIDERRRRMNAVALSPAAVRDLLDGSNSLARVADQLLGEKLRKLARAELAAFQAAASNAAARHQSALDGRLTTSHDAECSLHSWTAPVLPSIGKLVRSATGRSDRQICAQLVIARERYADELEKWLESASRSLSAALTERAAQVTARALAVALAEVPDLSGGGKPVPQQTVDTLNLKAAQLLAMADKIDRRVA